MLRRKWTEKEYELLIKMAAQKSSWEEIAQSLNRTPATCSKRFNCLQKNGKAPYKVGQMLLIVDEIQDHLKQFGHRSTIDKYGSYAIHFLKRNKLWKRSLPSIPVYPERFLASENKYYWAGFFAADGCVKGPKHVEIGLAIKDKPHLETIKALAGGTIYTRTNSATWSMHKCQEVVDFLKQLNITPRKSLSLCPPNSLNKFQTRDYIRGYFDGDGCVTSSIQKSGCLIQSISFNGTYKLLNWIREQIQSNTQVLSNPCIRATKGIHLLSYGSRHDFLAIGDWFYNDCGTHLERKKKRYEQIKSLILDLYNEPETKEM